MQYHPHWTGTVFRGFRCMRIFATVCILVNIRQYSLRLQVLLYLHVSRFTAIIHDWSQNQTILNSQRPPPHRAPYSCATTLRARQQGAPHTYSRAPCMSIHVHYRQTWSVTMVRVRGSEVHSKLEDKIQVTTLESTVNFLDQSAVRIVS